MKIARRVALAVAAVAALALVAAFLLPRHAVVTRTVEIAAPPASIYPLVGDLRRFNEWSPWAGVDPDAVYTFTGAVDGVGQTLNWRSGNPEVGTGSMAILALEPDRRVEFGLDFGAEGKAAAAIALEPADAGTKVVWVFDSDLGFNPIARYFGMMIDGVVGPDYEKGLARLKALAERPEATADAE